MYPALAFWMSDDDSAINIVPLLEASSLKTHVGLDKIELHWSWETAIGGGDMDGSLTGVADLTWRQSLLW